MPEPGSPSLTVDAVVHDAEGRIALVRRARPPFQDRWALPGGFVEIGETVEAACARETLEETGLVVEVGRLVGVFSRPGRDPRGHTVSVAFACSLLSGTIRGGDDAAEARWFSPEDLRGLPLAFDHSSILESAQELATAPVAPRTAEFPVYPLVLLDHPRWTGVRVAAEFALPTGSFKDRGAAAVVAGARLTGASRVVLDSSGNAGLAVAAAAARARIACTVHMARGAAPEKIRLIRAAGARVEIHATRAEAARACLDDPVAYDAGHVRNPLFRKGVASAAAAWNRIGSLPRELYLPVGNGVLLLGLADGFADLRDRTGGGPSPRMIAVQAENCAPIAAVGNPGCGRTIADGCAVADPPLAVEVREAIRRSGGEAVAISEPDIAAAWREAWRDGFPIEATSALAFAAARRGKGPSPGSSIVATGSGLKCPPDSESPA